ncbi:MAG: HAD hydrolase-like protein [Elusimicrobia bacterium]|nr:HAD hydrolase-like protein [Elusimicrobiota bacterium]
MAIKVIVFDLGKVIFDFDINKLSKDISLHSSKPASEIYSIMLAYAHKWESLFLYETGKISSQEFYENLKSVFSYNGTYEDFVLAWNSIFTPMENSINFIRSLRKTTPLEIAMLSNTNELHFEYLKNSNPEVFSWFNNFHLSHKMQSRKPESQIYQSLINFYKFSPEEIFFADDLEVNVSAARKHGIKAYTFTTVENLIADLKKEQAALT